MWLLQQLTGPSDVGRLPFLQHPSRHRTTTEGYTNCFLNFQDTSQKAVVQWQHLLDDFVWIMCG